MYPHFEGQSQTFSSIQRLVCPHFEARLSLGRPVKYSGLYVPILRFSFSLKHPVQYRGWCVHSLGPVSALDIRCLTEADVCPYLGSTLDIQFNTEADEDQSQP